MAAISLLTVFLILLSISCFIIWVWAIVDIIKSDFKDSVTKLVWLIVVIAFSFLGTILYFIFGRETKVKAGAA